MVGYCLKCKLLFHVFELTVIVHVKMTFSDIRGQEREGERNCEKKREIESNRQTDRHKREWTNRQTDRQTGIHQLLWF